MKTKRLYNALKKMRRLTEANIPFSITYFSCDLTRNSSSGLVTKENVMLRTGLSPTEHKKGRVLIGFKDFDTGRYGWFYLPLLKKVNNINIYD